MKKFIPAISLITLLSLQAPVEATWSSKARAQEKQAEAEANNTPGFNLHDDRSWFFEADYLFWKPTIENNSYATKVSNDALGDTITTNASLKKPNFKLGSGVRLGVGGYTSDRWDIALQGTYLYSNARKTSHANPSNGTAIAPDMLPALLGFKGLRAKSFAQINYGLLDLTFGREYFLTKRFAAHPFIGIRNAFINYKQTVHFKTIYEVSSLTATLFPKGSTKSNVWGIGPRLGFDLNYYLSKDWAFAGGLAGSILYTRYNIKENYAGYTVPNSSSFVPTFFNIKDKANLGRANLDAYFGLAYSHWYCNNTRRFTFAITAETQHWFGYNQTLGLVYDTTTNSTLPAIQNQKRTGDLNLFGGTIHFQFDF